ncbi:MAG: flavin reductase family protein [Candidatus Bathyarchaeia archaeon]|jgi:flavin reductase (DIM6/NTAB) family NADH-FMN oxidoreductase RutF
MKSEVSVRDGLGKLPIRPVYLVSCEDSGKRSILSVGMFAYFSGKPTLVGVGIAPSRFSYELIRKSRAFVVNVVDEKLIEAVRICGEKSGRDVDKFELARLTAVPASRVSAPLIDESPMSIECKVVQVIEAGDHVWFIGEVLATHVREGYEWKDGLLFKWIGEEGFYYKVGKNVARY